MKKDMPHAGFPEAAFQRYAEILVSVACTKWYPKILLALNVYTYVDNKPVLFL